MNGKRIGLVIGNNYSNSDYELNYAVDDALAMKEILLNKDICEFDHVSALINKTSREASREIERLLRAAGQNDLVFIYFSGHGKKDFENELCLLFNDTGDEALLATSLTFDFINKCRKYPSSKSVVIVLDCCYSGVAGIKGNDVTESLSEYSGSGTVILTSTGSTGSPLAKEDVEFGHGVFTYYLLKGLENGNADKSGDGLIYIDELYDYAYERTTKRCSQSPKMTGTIEGKIFIGKNSVKIMGNEYKLKTRKLLGEYFDELSPLVLNESLNALRTYYKLPSSLTIVDETIVKLLESLFKGDLSSENYNEAVLFVKQILEEDAGNISSYNTKRPKVFSIFTSSSMGIEFILIPPGKFEMGSPIDGSRRWEDESPIHEVTIMTPFYLGKYPVTQKQWQEVMDDSPSRFEGEALPVECVSWNEVQKFIEILNETDGANKYRLPSEAEWEYACRAGTNTRYSFDDDAKLKDYAWYEKNSGNETHPVGQKKPNPWGLYDMHGNIWEWTQDKWHHDYKSAPSDGSAWEGSGTYDRVVRGGSWRSEDWICRSADRYRCDPEYPYDYVGFRLLRDL